jgi:5-methylthioadenosine/S-adenosylhomocysteine deaminase
MALVIEGRILPLAADPAVPTGAFAGRVWIGDDGVIAAVTKGAKAGPAGFEDAPVVDVGSALVLPGLIDLHNHLAYNALPLWTEPSRRQPYPHHDSWPNATSYAPGVTWPAYAFIVAAPDELLAYVEAKAIIGGTTSIQGSPPKNRPRDNWLVRNIEDETWGTGDADLVYSSTLTMKPAQLADRANKMRAGSTFIYHCGEGQRGSLVAREFTDARAAGCLQERFVAVHANAIEPTEFARWTSTGAVVWSPLSNLWLYGSTTDVPAARAAGVTVCLGSDWSPSGSKSILGELKVARVVADRLGWELSDEDIVHMATIHPGDILARGWRRQTGRLQPGAIADITVIKAAPRAEPYSAVVKATETDVELVVIGGSPRYGTTELMKAAGAPTVTTLTVRDQSRALALRQPDGSTAWTWRAVIDRLEAVRENPKREIEAGQGRVAAFSGALDQPGAPLRLALDMPTGLTPVAGLPKDLSTIVVPELDTLVTDKVYLDFLIHHGFHGGLLAGVADFY